MVSVTPYIPPIRIDESDVFFEFESSAIIKCFRYPKLQEKPASSHLYSGMKVNYEMLVTVDEFVLLLKHNCSLFKREFDDASPLHSLPRRRTTVEAITGIKLDVCEFSSGVNFDTALRKKLKSKDSELMRLIRDNDLECEDEYDTRRKVDRWCERYNQEVRQQIYSFVRTHLNTHVATLKRRGWIEGRVEAPELQVEGYGPE